MKNNNFLYKITNNRKILFITPNLIYVITLLNYYNINFLKYGEVFFYEIVFLSLIFLILTTLIYLLISKVLKDKKKTFCILIFVCTSYFISFSLIQFFLFIVYILFLILILKKFISLKLDYVVTLLSLIIFFLSIYNFLIAGYNVLYSITNSQKYDYKISINIESNTNAPNIYWIHADGMTGINAMKKYFNFDNEHLLNYLNNNNFIINEDATLIAAHQTQESLVAMFNPYYYDNFFSKYLLDLENVYLKNSKKPSFLVNYHELEKKRLNNELFNALKKKDYSTVAIADFNPYTSFYTDYYYDFYHFGENIRNIDLNKSDLKLLNNNSKTKLLSYIRFTHLKPLINRTFFHELSNINYLNYDIVNYIDFDSSNYKYIDNAMNNSNFWLTKAILKGINDTLKIDNKKFVFIDFKLAHDPFTFDSNGNIISEETKLNVSSYLGNYQYSTYLLTDLLEYIKNNDENAIIIIQGDHGLHTIKDEIMQEFFEVNMKEVQDIRNSVISAYYIPNKYKNGEEIYLNNPLNISRYIINNFVGNNYEYIK